MSLSWLEQESGFQDKLNDFSISNPSILHASAPTCERKCQFCGNGDIFL
jgi:hypothetical protein